MRKGIPVAVILAAFLTLTQVCSAKAAPARAAVNVQVSHESYTMLDGCHYYSVMYSFTLPPGTTSWTADVDFIGSESASDYLYGSDSYDTTGRANAFLCASDDAAGHYFVSINGTYTNPTSGNGTISGSGSLRLQEAKTRTYFSVSDKTPRFNQVVQLFARVQVQGRRGYSGLKFGSVVLQVKLNGRWNDTDITFFTGSNGRDNDRYRWNLHRTLTLRLKTAAEDGHRESVSAPLTINPHEGKVVSHRGSTVEQMF